ncbi:hypothetical protein CEUSTIGMA_g8106.t1 [Chlamydomonas eustigma]|uniref:Adenosine deaminase domain-containing protein n=1 Tax=Chlamydomonas eustigma TaxID=1157962 RepID=A0A250XC71_9CHLO|nr:hypothetical protein CEUSTIGMA_g8106.t1 [Chlamydomonas eustigma]|eukprot:GAX80671.1 hypothetical protein CEUSTIGMA_g8106.t1 [Chlamydomonas eustigma]
MSQCVLAAAFASNHSSKNKADDTNEHEVNVRACSSTQHSHALVERGTNSKDAANRGPVQAFIAAVPKAELHIHLEGTLEPEMMLELAARNGLPPPYLSAEAARQAYQFKDLQSFLDLYYNGCAVLLTSQDFYDLAWAYFERAASENVKHIELFFDPQTHLERNVPFSTFLPGILDAVTTAKEKLGLNVRLIMCFLRHMSEESAIETLNQAKPFREHLLGVGLDSSEANRPPSLFKRVYGMAKALGLRLVAHAGEEGPAEYVWEAIKDLGVERVDHGIRSLEDTALVTHLEEQRIGITLCPLSNMRLKVFPDEATAARILGKFILETKLLVMLNSDDPAYFGGYLMDNYLFVQRILSLKVEQVARLAKNSFSASFLSDEERQHYHHKIDQVFSEYIKLVSK